MFDTNAFLSRLLPEDMPSYGEYRQTLDSLSGLETNWDVYRHDLGAAHDTTLSARTALLEARAAVKRLKRQVEREFAAADAAHI